MPRSDRDNWMWSEAVEMLTRAERMHRQFFQPQQASERRSLGWEPPVDVLETEREVLIVVALPGVDPDEVQAGIEDGTLIVVGHRILPTELRTAHIHRLELPQGRFERRIPLPPGRYSAVRKAEVHGCLLISLQKAA